MDYMGRLGKFFNEAVVTLVCASILLLLGGLVILLGRWVIGWFQ